MSIPARTDRQDSWPVADPEGARPGAWASPPEPDCAVGQQLFHPRHGVVCVRTIEWRERDGRSVEYLTLAVSGQELVLLVPRQPTGAGALRRMMTPDEAEAVLDELRSEPAEMPAWTHTGFAAAQRQVVDRNPLVVAGTVRDLAAKGRGKRLSTTDRTLFEQGAALLAAELAVVFGVSVQRARRLMNVTAAASATA